LTYGTDKVEEFNNGRVEDVVARAVGHERLDYRFEQIRLDNVLVVGLFFKTERLAQETQCGLKIETNKI
jgi:hypothetical protein